jgi:hypothetical protein
VAIDALAARIMGFDPLKLDYIRLAHERGLGVGDHRQIEVVGDVEIKDYDFRFTVGDSLLGQERLFAMHGGALARTPVMPEARSRRLARRCRRSRWWAFARTTRRSRTSSRTRHRDVHHEGGHS